MPDDKTLKDRVDDFHLMRLPGQSPMMHMGTSYLISDLWREIERLNAALSMTREGVDPDEAKRLQNAVT